MRIHLVINVSKVVWYRKEVEEQKVKEVKPVEIEGVEEYKVEKILDRKKSNESNEIFSKIEGIYGRI